MRPAGPDDLARCTELLTAAAAEVETRRGGPSLLARGAEAPVQGPVDPAAFVARLASGHHHRLVVGSLDDVTVGVAAGTVTGPDAAPLGRLECCYVEPGARGVSVGSALLADLVDWFTEQGCREVDAWALPGDRATKQLLEAAGLSARLLVLHRRLP